MFRHSERTEHTPGLNIIIIIISTSSKTLKLDIRKFRNISKQLKKSELMLTNMNERNVNKHTSVVCVRAALVLCCSKHKPPLRRLVLVFISGLTPSCFDWVI